MTPYHVTKKESAVMARALRAYATSLRYRYIAECRKPKARARILEHREAEAFECEWMASLIEHGAEVDFWTPTPP